MTSWLRMMSDLTEVERRTSPVDLDTLRRASLIVEDVRSRGESALLDYGDRFGDLVPGDALVVEAAQLQEAAASLDPAILRLLERTVARITAFAGAQREALRDTDVAVPGGRAGHSWIPVKAVGAYAPGGRHPLPSSVLMTVIPARVAGVDSVWVASPKPSPVTMAAAFLAGADGLVRAGGAQAIAALAFGTVSPPSDLVVGPGNRFVTAAKKYLYGEIGIDGLAGPSEIVVIADESASPDLVAADLIAQAEHDVDAIPMLVTTSREVLDAIEQAITRQLEGLSTAAVASTAFGNGFSMVVGGLDAAVAACDHIAPEHVALHVVNPKWVGERLRSYGSMFIGENAAEVFADYGVGPNHVLPTGGSARYQTGLSVATFLRSPTWLEIENPAEIADDSAALARIEGLNGHARAAELRYPS